MPDTAPMGSRTLASLDDLRAAPYNPRAIEPAAAIVLEPFGGSGSTLIACETTNRACRCAELMPVFVEVIVRRWEKFTGKTATLDGTGETLDDLAKTREAL